MSNGLCSLNSRVSTFLIDVFNLPCEFIERISSKPQGTTLTLCHYLPTGCWVKGKLIFINLTLSRQVSINY